MPPSSPAPSTSFAEPALRPAANVGGRGLAFLRHPAVLLLGPVLVFPLPSRASPLANLAVLSVRPHSATQLWTPELTLANFTQALDSYYFSVFLRSVRIAGTATLTCLLLGYPLAYFLARCSPRTLSIGLFLL